MTLSVLGFGATSNSAAVSFYGPIVAALMARPICFQKRDEELLHEFVLPGLRNDYVNQFQSRGWL